MDKSSTSVTVGGSINTAGNINIPPGIPEPKRSRKVASRTAIEVIMNRAPTNIRICNQFTYEGGGASDRDVAMRQIRLNTSKAKQIASAVFSQYGV